ncbi:Myb-related protein B [Apodemus speciosus]|uniref:Myb-related protein B n=1 Tax=Apodemus speciosus TaxID=105296 RepID=A0ABQ0ELJ0_APOSI
MYPGCPGTHSIETRLASNSEIRLPLPPRVLGLQTCATIARLKTAFKKTQVQGFL